MQTRLVSVEWCATHIYISHHILLTYLLNSLNIFLQLKYSHLKVLCVVILSA